MCSSMTGVSAGCPDEEILRDDAPFGNSKAISEGILTSVRTSFVQPRCIRERLKRLLFIVMLISHPIRF